MQEIVSGLLLVAVFAAGRHARGAAGCACCGLPGREPMPSNPARRGGHPRTGPRPRPAELLLGRWEGAGVGGDLTIEFPVSARRSPSAITGGRTSLTRAGAACGTRTEPGPPPATDGHCRPSPAGELEVVLADPTGTAETYLGEATCNKI